MPKAVSTPNIAQVNGQDGGDAGVALECPHCGKRGWAALRQLSHLMNCTECGGLLWLGRDGRLHSDKEEPAVRTYCPRCRGLNLTPVGVVVRNYRCSHCGLNLSLHDEPALHKPISEKAHQKGKDETGKQPRRRNFYRLLIPGAVGVVVLSGLWCFRSPGPDQELVQAANAFMMATVRGDKSGGARWVMPESEADYNRWLKTEFDQVVGSFKVGSQAGADLDIVQDDPPRTWLQVTLHGVSEDDKILVLAWQETGPGQWRMDATATFQRYRSESSR